MVIGVYAFRCLFSSSINTGVPFDLCFLWQHLAWLFGPLHIRRVHFSIKCELLDLHFSFGLSHLYSTFGDSITEAGSFWVP